MEGPFGTTGNKPDGQRADTGGNEPPFGKGAGKCMASSRAEGCDMDEVLLSSLQGGDA